MVNQRSLDFIRVAHGTADQLHDFGLVECLDKDSGGHAELVVQLIVSIVHGSSDIEDWNVWGVGGLEDLNKGLQLGQCGRIEVEVVRNLTFNSTALEEWGQSSEYLVRESISELNIFGEQLGYEGLNSLELNEIETHD